GSADGRHPLIWRFSRLQSPQTGQSDHQYQWSRAVIAGLDTASRVLPDLRRIILRNSGKPELRFNPSLPSQKAFLRRRWTRGSSPRVTSSIMAMPPTRLDAPAPLGPHPLPMSTIESICVYCASGPGNNPAFMDAARKFGRILAENRIRLVYGGGSVGLMGALAESVLDHGGAVTGVIPDFLVNREHMLLRVQERIITPDMHERKRVMFERADAFVALPGGVGTLEELVEQLTWAQLGRHKKPILI